ncbi:MAG: UbiX family flavin prenyltransferase [Planctomycetes bacterium]|nr:UbiX family flavin prenyltransferase [Planctomycetota bacterium]
MANRHERKSIVVGVTGASGAVYAHRLITCLADSDVDVHLVVTPAGERVVRDELGSEQGMVQTLAANPTKPVNIYACHDVGARIASGSFLTDGMVVCPCSSNTLGALASGLADNLLRRAAAVTLKQARRLVLVPREMPTSRIDLQNALRLSEAGAIICPASPAFYMLPKTVGELVDSVVGRVLDLLDVPHRLNVRWADRVAATEQHSDAGNGS